MIDDLARLLEQLRKHATKLHGVIHDSCLARMGETQGILGYSSAVWTKVWFDTTKSSMTLYEGSLENCKAKYEEFRTQMGVGNQKRDG
jgi:hypothetical protein